MIAPPATYPKSPEWSLVAVKATFEIVFPLPSKVPANGYKLEPMMGEIPPFSGKATTSVIMNQNIQGFANLREERDAHGRVARTLADQIYYRLALYFAGHPSSSKGENDKP